MERATEPEAGRNQCQDRKFSGHHFIFSSVHCRTRHIPEPSYRVFRRHCDVITDMQVRVPVHSLISIA